jgi:beta-xylosidase
MSDNSVTNSYRNPILSGFNPDPSICYAPGLGYFVSTSTFEYFPGLPIYHSKDLVTWNASDRQTCYMTRTDEQLIGHAINRRSQGVDMRTVESSAGLWAPTFRYHKSKWYMICSCFWRLRISDVSVTSHRKADDSLAPISYLVGSTSVPTTFSTIQNGQMRSISMKWGSTKM